MRLRAGGASLALLLLVAACAGGGDKPRPASKPAQTVKIGKPYQVFGIWYYPSDDRDYDETGVASWYGPGFHALDTANGERYGQLCLESERRCALARPPETTPGRR